MHDYLLDIGRRPALRRLVSSIGLPVPQELERQTAPWEEKPLSGRRILVGGTGEFPEILLDDLIGSGAEIAVTGEHAEAFLAGGKRVNHPVIEEKEGATGEVYGMLFDATGFRTTEDLDRLYDFFHPRIRRIGRCGRIVVLGRPPEETHDVEEAATLRAIEGFVRSVAKEIGRKGATANLLYVEPGAEVALEGPLRFLCSPRSAYISGQPIPLTKRVKLPTPIPFVSPLSGKRALVTGAARGIGAAITTLLTREGAHVVALDRPEDRQVLAEVVEKTRATPLLQDVSAPDAAERIAEALREEGIDIVVHNAGVTRDRTLAKMDRRFWREAIGINLTAVIRITQRLIADDSIHHNGRIVCLSSVAGIAGNFGQTNYAASKAGIIGFVENLAGRVARRGITVNAIAPGFIETRLTEAIPFMTREVGRRLCNLSQGGKPHDIAETVTFLASPGAAGITGSVIRVCGGSLLGA